MCTWNKKHSDPVVPFGYEKPKLTGNPEQPSEIPSENSSSQPTLDRLVEALKHLHV